MSSESKDGILAVSGSLLGLSTLVVGLRLCARKQQNARLMTDDALAVLSLVAFVGTAACTFLMVKHKTVGYPSTDFTVAEALAVAETAAKLNVAWDVLGLTSLACTKLSALFFYRRVFCVHGWLELQWFSIATFVTIVLVVLWDVVYSFLPGFQCGTHFSALWDGTYEEYCTISFPFLYGLAVSDFLLDVWILFLPIPRILQLHATASQKSGFIGVFALAFVGLGASITRMVIYIQVENGGASYFLTHDQDLIDTKSIYFAMLETGISLIAVNLPSLWMLFTSVTPEKVIRSIRSVISIGSLRSRGSSRGDVDNAVGKASTSGSTRPSESSGRLRNDVEAQKAEVYATPDEIRPHQEELGNGVHIHSTVSIHHQPHEK